MKLEPFNQPAALRLFHLYIETEPAIGPKLDFFANQFSESAFERIEPWKIVGLLQPAAVRLFRQIMTKLPTKSAGMIDNHLREG